MRVISVLLSSALLSACSQPHEVAIVDNGTETAAQSPETDTIKACVERGEAYFREIGSYPTLKSAPNAGRSAVEVAAERCERTTTAF